MAKKLKDDDIEVTYLTNACGEDTGYGAVSLKKSDYAKVAFEEGPGVVLPYIVEIKGKKHVLGNLEVAYKDDFWGDDGKHLESEDCIRAYCETMCSDIRTRIGKDMRLLPLDEDMPGRFVVGVAIPLEQLADSAATSAALAQVFGKFVGLPDLAEA